MHIGVVFPQTEIGPDRAIVREYAQVAEGSGLAHLLVYDHVLGASTTNRPDWRGPYTDKSLFHEVFVLFGYLAAVAPVELVTGVLVLPQRQTALVAKQAAEIDILTNGRLRLGIGIGWNAVEYEALGESFGSRGRRMSEQIPLLRRFWTESAVSHDGDFDHVTAAGLAPLPVQRPIPIWIGGQSAPAYRRVGRLADGWFPQVAPGPRLDEATAIVADAALAAGRDPAALGMEGRVSWSDAGLGKLIDQAGRWRDAGATHLSVNTMNAGLGAVGGHLDVLAAVAAALDELSTG
jgi:probable F420-dependent oxidoreductase